MSNDALAHPLTTPSSQPDMARRIRSIPSAEGVTVYESEDAMRFGPRYYDESQVAIIHAAVAERQDLPAPALPLD